MYTVAVKTELDDVVDSSLAPSLSLSTQVGVWSLLVGIMFQFRVHLMVVVDKFPILQSCVDKPPDKKNSSG